MRCNSNQTNLATVFNMIEDEELDLQPDFQRSEVWTKRKKQKLVDSILRGWNIPPVHLVELDDGRYEVLDGQQRLTTIRDFMRGELAVDGKMEPSDERIAGLHGLAYDELPERERRKFRQYDLTVVKVQDCTPEESGELFFRLNQPQPLTSAEQRNAFMGVPRNQVKALSAEFVTAGASKETIGFSNSRLAYDEIISKFCYAIEAGTLRRKITSNDISAQYRKNTPFSEGCIRAARLSLTRFIEGVRCADLFKPSFNKATVYSWLVFIKRNTALGNFELGSLIGDFEYCRNALKLISGQSLLLDDTLPGYKAKAAFFEPMLAVYTQRSSMASTDVTSIIYRDIVVSLFEELHLGHDASDSRLIEHAAGVFKATGSITDVLSDIQAAYKWGERF